MTKVFDSGSMKIKHLDDKVTDRLSNIVASKYSVIVGDADGVDSSIQEYLKQHGVSTVTVYCSGTRPRNNIGGREHAGVVDAHGVHPVERPVDVAVPVAAPLEVRAILVPGHAAAEALVADLVVEEAGTAGPRHRVHGLHLDDGVLDVAEHVLVGLALVVVRVHIDDQEVLVVALPRLLAGMLERLGFRVLLGIELADFVSHHVHERCPRLVIFR